MQSFDTANPNAIAMSDADSDHLDKLYNIYVPRLGLNRNQFIEYVQAHQAGGGLIPNLNTNQVTNNGIDPVTPMAQALKQQAKAAQDDEYYQADVGTQLAQQDLQAEARVADEDNRRAQAVSDAQSVAFGPKADADADNNTFNQILFRGGGSGSQPQTPQTTSLIRGSAQKANFLSAAQRRFRFPKALGARR